MRQIILKAFLCTLVIGCESLTESPSKVEDLENIYQKNDTEAFRVYLLRWITESKSIKPGDFEQLPDTLQAIYRLFETFYNPFDMNRYCTSGRCPEFGPDIYEKLEYVIVQYKISYVTGRPYKVKEKINFRPHINLDKTILYLLPPYKETLDAFLNIDEHRDDLSERITFLNQYLKIIPGHWFGWHYITHPVVEMVYLNPALDSASVHFRIVYEGGEANYKRVEDEWHLVSSYLTWIE